jgi:hypothetical protein
MRLGNSWGGFIMGSKERTDVTCPDYRCNTEVPFKPYGSSQQIARNATKIKALPSRQGDIKRI